MGLGAWTNHQWAPAATRDRSETTYKPNVLVKPRVLTGAPETRDYVDVFFVLLPSAERLEEEIWRTGSSGPRIWRSVGHRYEPEVNTAVGGGGLLMDAAASFCLVALS